MDDDDDADAGGAGLAELARLRESALAARQQAEQEPAGELVGARFYSCLAQEGTAAQHEQPREAGGKLAGQAAHWGSTSGLSSQPR